MVLSPRMEVEVRDDSALRVREDVDRVGARHGEHVLDLRAQALAVEDHALAPVVREHEQGLVCGLRNRVVVDVVVVPEQVDRDVVVVAHVLAVGPERAAAALHRADHAVDAVVVQDVHLEERIGEVVGAVVGEPQVVEEGV